MKNNGSTAQKKKKPSFLITFICIFVGVLMVFGIVTGIIIAVKNARAVARAGSISIEEGVANYFASQFKIIYIAGLRADQVSGVEDDADFWERKAEDGKTYGEHFNEEFRIYLSEIIAGNIIFNNYGRLDGNDKRIIEDTIASVLRWRADDSKEKFNEISAKYGFDYDDFCVATELQYKSERAKALIYGSDGLNIDESLADEFYENYTHVSLAFIRTDYKRVLNETTGAEEYVEIDSVERAERLERIEELRRYVDNIKTGNGEMMTAATFREILNDYEGDPTVEFYFFEGSLETAEFAKDYAEVVNKSYELANGEFGYAECDVPADESIGFRGFVGTCFIYKTEDMSRPYLNDNNTFFSDFFTLASSYYYSQNLKEFSSDVEFTELYYEKVDPVSIPTNNELCIMGWVQ